MIEVNLHPDRGKAARRGVKLSLPAALSRSRSTRPKSGGGDRDVWTMMAIAVPVLVALVVGWLWFSQRTERSDLEARMTDAVADSARLADLRSLSDSLSQRNRRIGERVELVRSFDEGRFVWPHLLDEISRALPAYTWLTLVRRSAPLPNLEVQVDGLAANALAITRFVRNLQDSPYIGNVRIMGSQQRIVDGVSAQAFQLMVFYETPSADLVRSEPIVEGS